MPTVSETDVAKVDNANATDPDDTEPISLAVSEELIDLPSPEQSLSTEPTLRGTILSPKERPFKSRRSSKTVAGGTYSLSYRLKNTVVIFPIQSFLNSSW
ncbi:unnamed protein product [Dibothriocephalus latus]|uniref:Uncharacterized protein n=1 Tax=Dibothriocephalus latus TaxID=60516 RepID=A0A3P7NEZ4_DIBLA|nr:unnamed protein product [Dibothriocephalus latus]